MAGNGAWRMVPGLAGRLRQHLHLARLLELPHPEPCLGDGAADGQQAVVAHDHRILVSEVGHEPLPLVDVHSHSLELVVSDALVKLVAVLLKRQQAFRQRRHGHSVGRVGVHHAGHVVPGRVDGGVDDVAGDVDPVITLVEDVPVHVDLDEVRCRDLLVPETVLIDEELVLRARDTRRDVVVDERRHAEVVGEAIRRGQVHASLPLGLGEVVSLSLVMQ